MEILLYLILTISGFLAVVTGINYVSHPLAGSGLVKYAGGKFWLVSFIVILVLYLKG